MALFESWFEGYWQYFGLPLSRMKGPWVDSVPFSVVEGSLYFGLTFTLLWVTSWLPFPAGQPSLLLALFGRILVRLRRHRRIWGLGPIFLVILGMGQGAFPWSLAPTAYRPALSQALPHPPLSAKRQDVLVEQHLQSLWRELTPQRYASLNETEALVICDRLLDSVLKRLQLTPGRQVRSIKAMGPLTSTLGLVYGGPAFHDPFFGELAMIKPEAMPSSKYWRVHAACHEAAHAKGFTREMDAEILTQFAFSLSSDPRFRALGDLMYLAKSGQPFPIPPPVKSDMEDVRRRRKGVEQKQVLIAWLRRWAERLHLRNQPGKYGDRARGEPWNEHHPFYSTIAGFLDKSPPRIGDCDSR